MSFIQNVRAMKGFAPTAGQFNKLGNNQDYLNTRTTPRAALLQIAADTTVTFPASGAGFNLNFTSSVFDTESMVSSAIITVPSDAVSIRMIANCYFTTFATREFLASLQQFGVRGSLFEVGYGGTGNGVQAFNLDTGWMPTVGGNTYNAQVFFGGTSSTSLSGKVQASAQTWFSVEVL